ncbi:MAG TPA: MFS transporter [Spirochaetia bacterium]|nr:MFS transporter [Spirochaetia bacterium]
MTEKGNPARGLAGATLGFFFGFAAVALFGTTAQTFRETLGLNQMTVGLLLAIPSLMGSLLRIPFAAWVDSVGGRTPFLVLLSLSVVGMLGLAVTVSVFSRQLGPSSFPLILALGALCGCGIATFSVGISQVSYWFPRASQGAALGIYGGVGNLAPGVFTLILPVALAALGLGGAYWAWLLMLVVGAVLYFFLGVNAPYFQARAQGKTAQQARQEAAAVGQEMFPSGNARQSLATSAGQWRTWLLVIVYFTSFGGFMAMTAWLPSYWRVFLGVSAVGAGILAAVYSLTTSLVRIAGGSMSDRLGGERTAMGALLLMAVGALMMIFTRGVHGVGFALAAELVMAVGMGITNAAVFKLVPKVVPNAIGGASGWVGGLGAFGGFAIPPILSLFVSAEKGRGYADGFGVFLVLALVSLALIVVLDRSRAAREEKVSRKA